jgi:hypothetical protein
VNEDVTLGLAVRSGESELALLVLLRMTENADALRFIAKHREWMYAAPQYPLATFRLFLAVFRLQKKVIADDPLFGFVLRAAIDTADREAIAAIPIVIAQCQLSRHILGALSRAGVLVHYRDAARDLGLIGDFVSVLAALVNVGYVDDFAVCMDLLVAALNTSHLSGKALDVVLKLAAYPKGAQLLRQVGFVQYCEYLQKAPEWANLAGRLAATLKREAFF